MPVQVSYPGVYIDEIPSFSQTVTAASTASTLFAGFFSRGPMGKAVRVESWTEFMRVFGGLDQRSEASYGIYQYFNNGGQTAWVVRLGDGQAESAEITIPVISPELSEFSKEAQQAAELAQSAAKTALAALADSSASHAAIGAGEAAELAAQATTEAAAAARNAGEELSYRIEQYDAKYGPEAEATREAAAAAAQAAQEAATTAQKAQDAAQAAASSTPPNPTDNTLTAAQKVVETQIADAVTAFEKNYKSGSTSTGDISALCKLAHEALDADKTSPDKESPLRKPLETSIGAGAEAERWCQQVTQKATAAQAAVAGATANPPNGSVEAVQEAVQATDIAAGKSISALTAWLETAEEISKMKPSTQVASAIDQLIKGIQQALQASAQGLGATQIAATGASLWRASLDEGALRSGTGIEDACTQALKTIRQALGVGSQLLVKDPAGSTSGSIEKDIANLQSAEATLVQVSKAIQTDQAPPKLQKLLSELKTQAQQVAGSVIGQSGVAAMALDWAIGQVASYLWVSLVADLVSTVEPVNAAMVAAQGAVAAAEKAAAKARIAMQKARLAELAGLEDEADSQTMMIVSAADPGTWGNSLQIEIVRQPQSEFSIQVREMGLENDRLVSLAQESYSNLTLGNTAATNYAPSVVNDQSNLIQLSYAGLSVPGTRPNTAEDWQSLAGGRNGAPPAADDLFPVEATQGSGLPGAVKAMKPNIFNILCLPVIASYPSGAAFTAIEQAMKLAAENRAFFIADIPASIKNVSAMTSWMSAFGNADAYHGAVYYPRLLVPDPLNNYRNRNVGPSGTLAGIYATNDLNYGVWKAPAGTTAVIENAELATIIDDQDSGILNEAGINGLRNFASYGNVVWGSRTMAGATILSSPWKYVNVRRLADFIEDSLYQSLKWAVFQDNGPRLWAEISTEVGSFMAGLFSAGAFQGTSPSQAYSVKCDSSTTTPDDVSKGIVNVLVGFAPIKPAEFVIVKIQQLTGQSAG